MSRRQPQAGYWQEAPRPRQQLVLVQQALESLIPPDHPVRLVDEILEQLDWTSYEAAYHGRRGQPPTKRFDKSAFVYDEASDQYFCPAGKPLPHRTTENTTHGDGKPVVRSVYTCRDCAGCPLAARCRRNPDSPRGREIMHDEHEGARRRHRQRMSAPEAEAARGRRQHFGELPFAVIKVGFGMRRFLLRGIEGVRQEWRWAATAFNLRKLLAHVAVLRADRVVIAE